MGYRIKTMNGGDGDMKWTKSKKASNVWRAECSVLGATIVEYEEDGPVGIGYYVVAMNYTKRYRPGYFNRPYTEENAETLSEAKEWAESQIAVFDQE